jgi:metal-sulfur cluster biosynthetic enzyme
MDPEMKKNIDEALSSVREPQSNIPIADLGLVEKITYSEKEKTLLVRLVSGLLPYQCPACSAINGIVLEGIRRRLRESLEMHFPQLHIIIE